MSEPHTVDLSLCTTDELWDELKSRFSDSILVYQRPTKVSNDFEHVGCWWSASFAARMGLAQYAVEKFKDQFVSTPEHEEDTPDMEPPDEDV